MALDCKGVNMNQLAFLSFKKLKNGMWECKDQKGNTATGLTKEMAENQYYVLYQLGTPKIDFDFTQFLK